MDESSGSEHLYKKPSPPSDDHPITFTSTDLFKDEKEICIRHGEELYKLRITRNGKLILTK